MVTDNFQVQRQSLGRSTVTRQVQGQARRQSIWPRSKLERYKAAMPAVLHMWDSGKESSRKWRGPQWGFLAELLGGSLCWSIIQLFLEKLQSQLRLLKDLSEQAGPGCREVHSWSSWKKTACWSKRSPKNWPEEIILVLSLPICHFPSRAWSLNSVTQSRGNHSSCQCSNVGFWSQVFQRQVKLEFCFYS